MQNRLNISNEQIAPSANGAGKVNTNGPVITIGLLDPDDLLREGVAALIGKTEDLLCVGDWSTPEDAMQGLAQTMPDVLLVDVKMPERAMFELLKALPTISPGTRVIATVDCREDRCVVLNPQSPGRQNSAVRILSQELAQPDDCLQMALKMGVQGALHRQRPFREIARAIRAVHSGQYWIEPPTALRLAQQHLLSLRRAHTAERGGPDMLTLRERQVLTLIAEGRSNKEIARELQLGYSTVKNYVSSILEKLGLSDRTQLALFAIQQISTEQEAPA
jgi:DNA-binding NarL/FixJ family response regulator